MFTYTWETSEISVGKKISPTFSNFLQRKAKILPFFIHPVPFLLQTDLCIFLIAAKNDRQPDRKKKVLQIFEDPRSGFFLFCFFCLDNTAQCASRYTQFLWLLACSQVVHHQHPLSTWIPGHLGHPTQSTTVTLVVQNGRQPIFIRLPSAVTHHLLLLMNNGVPLACVDRESPLWDGEESLEWELGPWFDGTGISRLSEPESKCGDIFWGVLWVTVTSWESLSRRAGSACSISRPCSLAIRASTSPEIGADMAWRQRQNASAGLCGAVCTALKNDCKVCPGDLILRLGTTLTKITLKYWYWFNYKTFDGAKSPEICKGTKSPYLLVDSETISAASASQKDLLVKHSLSLGSLLETKLSAIPHSWGQ
jgi:hypothetical protein